MDNEKIFMFLVLCGVVVFVAWETKKNNAAAIAVSPDTNGNVMTQPDDGITGPAYLTYNSPWGFAPPVGNVLPAMASSTATMISSGCGCGGD